MSQIYLDNNATTMIDPDVLQIMQPYFGELFGNPNSLHKVGINTHEGIELASDQLYRALTIDEKDSLIITSSATESINSVHKSILFDYLKQNTDKNQIITSPIEHPAVRKSLAFLEEFGIEIIELPLIDDTITVESIKEHLNPKKTLLVSIAYVNSETGVILPLQQISTLCKENNILIHTDATQAIGKIPINLKTLPVDYLSFSGHKFHGPKGVGGLFVRKDAPFTPLLHGGEQMGGFRSGTLNVSGIVGMGKALELAVSHLDSYHDHTSTLRELLEKFLEDIPECTIYGKTKDRIPNTSFFNIPSLDLDLVIWHLNNHHISVSTGIACTTKNMSSQLLDPNQYKGIRVSLSRFTTKQDIVSLIDALSILLTQ